jgi:hypothetical protein
MALVTLADVQRACQSNDLLGITDVATVNDYITRAIDIAQWKCNWNPWLATLDLCSDCSGFLTLPSFVGTVLAANVGGQPAWFRNSWYQFHQNGVGSCGNAGMGNGVGSACGGYWDDNLWSPTFQDLTQWSYLAAICEDPIDGNGTLQMIVQGETMDANYNQKEALTIPTSGPSQPGVILTLLNGYAATDPKVTAFKKIFQVTKPITRGYVKLIGFPAQQLGTGVTIGYYAPNETNPTYRRVRVSAKCQWVRIRYRRTTLVPVNSYDLIPFESLQVMIDLIKAIRLRETQNIDLAEKYELKAIELLTDQLNIQLGPGWAPVQIEPGVNSGTLDWR